jgi:DNA helicase II / ATP-dependent DNA helicase PcrA
MTVDLLHNLNPQQYAAVTATTGPVLVLAGPGSGKTGVLTRRIAFLIREMNVKPWHIMAVTFTNKAANEMRQRVMQYLDDEKLMGFQIGTFHATCARILRQEIDYTPYKKDFLIYDTDDQLAMVTQALQDLDLDIKKNSPRSVLAEISRAKNEMILPQQYMGTDYFTEVVSRVYPRYQHLMQHANAMDFDDLLMQMVLALQNSPMLREKYQRRYDFVLVDEFQDTNSVQYQLVQLFGAPQNNIFVVGDEDQSIYAFRGADYRNVLRFRHDYPASQVILLEQNYRSTQIVLDAARAVIDHNKNRTVKALFTNKIGGERITVYEAYDDEYEARYITEQIESLRGKGYRYGDMAIMYRTNGQSRALEDRLIYDSIPYTIVGDVSFYKRREIKDILGYLRLVNNIEDRVSFERVVNIPKRGIGEKSVKDFFVWLERDNLTIEAGLTRLVQGNPTPLATRTAKPMAEFAMLLFKWRDSYEDGKLLMLFDDIVADLRYRFYLRDISDNPGQAQEREDNLDVLRASMHRADEEEKPLAEVMSDAVLMQEATEAIPQAADRVTLLTLHAAKGLEFPIVFITGIEEGLLPHFRSLQELDGVEEERRLFYVGITRAEERLYLTYAFRRNLYTGGANHDKSHFLLDIPLNLIDNPPATLSAQGNEYRFSEITKWESKPAQASTTGGLGRLNADLQKAKQESFAPNPKFAGKIVPFPGGVTSKPFTYKTGTSVFHDVFGQGMVIESAWDGGDEIVTIAFSDKRYGIKKIFVGMTNLRVLK